MTKIDIISGFLGAGKTTFIKKMIDEAFTGEKIVLIENEFGEVGIDGGFLKDAGIQITEMNSGCICCSLVGDFGKNLNEVITKYHPDRILIEPSGVGKLSDVMKSVIDIEKEQDVKLNALVTVVNALKASKQMKAFGEFFNNQIEYATTVILSRSQNATPEQLEFCVNKIQELNPKAAIITTDWEKLSGEQILKVMEGQDNLEMKALAEAHHAKEEAEHEHEHHHHDHDHEDHEHHHDHEDHDHEHDENCTCGCHDHEEHEHHHEHDEHEHHTLNTILAKNEMKSMNIIIGPMHQNQIKPLSDFAEKNDIRLVIPFSQKGEEVFKNPAIYQINTPQSYLYSEVYEHFTRQFPNANVIFIEPSSADKEKAEFISGLKQELKSKGIPMRTVSESATKETLKATLRSDKENIFIPTSGSNVLLIKVLPQLTLLVRENPAEKIHLFGYPEWQTYTRDHLENFFELDVYFYSSFYTNTLFPAAVQFTNAYHKWYSKDLASKYPNYAMLGFDTGFFFLKGLSLYSSELENNLPKMNLTPIQTGFKFQRVNNWGGFINKKVFFIRFTKNFELVKLDFE